MKNTISKAVACSLAFCLATSGPLLQISENVVNVGYENEISNNYVAGNSDDVLGSKVSLDSNGVSTQNNASMALRDGAVSDGIFPADGNSNSSQKYALNDGNTTLKYFPVTMYNYNKDAFNTAASKLEAAIDDTVAHKDMLQAFGFKNNMPNKTYGYDEVTIEDNITLAEGYYVIYSLRSKFTVNADSSEDAEFPLSIGGLDATTTKWYIKKTNDGSYTVQDPTSGLYISIIDDDVREAILVGADQAQKFNIIEYKYSTDALERNTETNAVMFKVKGENLYLNDYGQTHFGGWNSSTDYGSAFYLYKVALDQEVTDALLPTEIDENIELEDGSYKIADVTNDTTIKTLNNDLYTDISTGTEQIWQIKRMNNGNYTIKDADGKYLSVGDGTGVVTDGYTECKITSFTNHTNDIQIGSADGAYWLQVNSDDNKYFAGSTANGDASRFMLLRMQEDVFLEKVENIGADGETVDIEDGKYIITGSRENKSIKLDELDKNNQQIVDRILGECDRKVDATMWNIKKQASGYYTLQDERGRYLSTTASPDKTDDTVFFKMVDYPVEFSISAYYNGHVVLCDETNQGTVGGNSVNYYINAYRGTADTIYCGYYIKEDENKNNAFDLYKVDEVALRNVVYKQKYKNADWNEWTEGPFVYDGIAKSTLDANKNIQFNYIDAGVFDSNTSIKDIYTNVEMPFLYQLEDSDNNGQGSNTYTFDSNIMSARFDGAATSNTRLSVYGEPQMNGGKTGWFPYNDATDVGAPDYHFGMIATIPFAMTPNGRINQLDDESEPIKFEFSGDDDIWVFVDGQLVLDLGGIHDRVGGEIDFSTNTWRLLTPAGAKEEVAFVSGKSISGDVFKTNDNTDYAINQTIESFSETDSHELTIFYLERGEGESNCKIKFNLPMKDYVTVTKKAERSYATDGSVTSLTASEKQMVNNVNFGFTLYMRESIEDENGVQSTVDTPVANVNYGLLNENGQLIDNPSTDLNGHFYLKNGQTARFITDILEDTGSTYYVVEDAVNGFSKTQYTYMGSASKVIVDDTRYDYYEQIPANNQPEYIDNNSDTEIKSKIVTAIGREDENDSLQFICENYLDADMKLGELHTQDDIIVIDYGLGVKINPLLNDVWRGDSIEITSVVGARYGTLDYTSDTINYTLLKQLSEIEKLTYTARVTYGNQVGQNIRGTVYIVPATTMYYEEDFSMNIKENSFIEVSVPNGDFEDGETTWEFTGTKTEELVGNNATYWRVFNCTSSSNTTKVFETCNKTGMYETYTCSQTITGLPNGVYYASIEGMGGNDPGDHTTTFTAGGKRVAVTPNEWSVWITYKTDTFEVTDGTCQITITSTVNNEYVNMDNVRLYRLVEDEPLVYYNSGKNQGTNGWTRLSELNWYNSFQEPGIVGTIGDSPYGSDMAYLSDKNDSNGTSMHVDTTAGAAQFSYDFVGTGTAFYARTSDSSGYIRVVVTDSNGKVVETWYRNTIYTETDNYEFDEEGNKVVTEWKENTLYNIPVYSKKDLPYGTYNVTVTIAKQTARYGKDFWLDGIRIYNPLGTDLSGDLEIAHSAYSIDGEANNTVVTLRDKILNDITEDKDGQLIWSGEDKTDGNFVLFTDTNGDMSSASEYKSDGPKEEVYLKQGQSISFSLANWDSNQHFVYLGVKAPQGSGKIIVNGAEISINNATDCYYLINPTVVERNGIKYGNFQITVATDSAGFVSLTTLKVTGTAQFGVYEKVGPESVEWSDIDYLSSDLYPDYTQQFKVLVAKGTVSQVVSVQKYGGKPAIYINVGDLDTQNFIIVNGVEVYEIGKPGTGLYIYLSDLTQKYNTVEVYTAKGKEKFTLYIYNKYGA